MDKEQKKRTPRQNNGCHLLCDQIATTMVQYGIPMNVIITDIQVDPTPAAIKIVMQQLGLNMFGKVHTSDWTVQEMQQIADLFTNLVREKTKGIVDIPFPSITNTVEYLTELEKNL